MDQLRSHSGETQHVADAFPAVLTCSWTSVAAGGAAPPITIAVTAPDIATILINDVTVVAATTDPNAANSATQADTTVAERAAIEIPTLGVFGLVVLIGALSIAALMALRRAAGR